LAASVRTAVTTSIDVAAHSPAAIQEWRGRSPNSAAR
jgi:hypothetical protein